MAHWHTPDTQTLIACALGLVATLHVLRRWWPTWAGLMLGKRTAAVAPASGQTGCGQADADSASSTASAGSGCAAGCGQCGNNTATAPKDHRVHIVRRAKS